MSKQLTLLISETLIRDEFNLACCSTNQLKLLMPGLGECPVCHALWRKCLDCNKWEQTSIWFCPDELANGCAFNGTKTCETCPHATMERHPMRIKFSV